MALMKFGVKIQDLEEKIVAEVEKGTSSEVEKGKRFCDWVLKYLFERSDDEVDECTDMAGKHDFSVDAWYEENNSLNIFQAKYKSAHNWAQVAEFIKNMEKIILNPFSAVANNIKLSELASLIEQYRENQQKELNLYYITSSNLTDTEKEHIKFHLNKFEEQFPEINLHIFGIEEIEEYLERELSQLPKRYKGKPAKLLLKNNFISNITCVAEVALKDFAIFVRDNKEYLFYSNVRNYLKNTTVNKAISETFQEKPTDFWYYNNGITIVCDDFNFQQPCGDLLTIITPQIVNGCQTANTIFNECRKLDKDRTKNLQGTILVKIIKDINGNKRDYITQYTNNQNAVSGMDFYALDNFQKKLKRDFAELNYCYEIQRKSSLTLSPSELKKYKGAKQYAYLFSPDYTNIIPVKEVVQAFAAGMHQLPATASSRLNELAPFGKTWSVLFNTNTPDDIYHFFYPYGVMQFAKHHLGYDNKKGVGFRKNCLLLFVTVYFKTLCCLLKKIDRFEKYSNVEPLRIELNYLKALFGNSSVNISVLKLTDEILQYYMKDSGVKALYGDNLPKFLKSAVQTNTAALEIMLSQINNGIDDYSSIDLQAFIDLIENAS